MTKAEKSFAIHYVADLRPADGDTRRTSGVFLPLTDGHEPLVGRSERSIFARANGKIREAT